jgi:hypothetical protein
MTQTARPAPAIYALLIERFRGNSSEPADNKPLGDESFAV